MVEFRHVSRSSPISVAQCDAFAAVGVESHREKSLILCLYKYRQQSKESGLRSCNIPHIHITAKKFSNGSIFALLGKQRDSGGERVEEEFGNGEGGFGLFLFFYFVNKSANVLHSQVCAACKMQAFSAKHAARCVQIQN